MNAARIKPSDEITGGGETLIKSYKSTKKLLAQITAHSEEIFGKRGMFMNGVLHEIVSRFREDNMKVVIKIKDDKNTRE